MFVQIQGHAPVSDRRISQAYHEVLVFEDKGLDTRREVSTTHIDIFVTRQGKDTPVSLRILRNGHVLVRRGAYRADFGIDHFAARHALVDLVRNGYV